MVWLEPVPKVAVDEAQAVPVLVVVRQAQVGAERGTRGLDLVEVLAQLFLAGTVAAWRLGAVEQALRARRRKPMFMVDIAVPRDIEPEVGKLSDVYLYTVDDLSTLVQTAGEKRQAAVEQAEAIIDAGVQSFAHWLDQRAAVPLIQALNRQADDWRAAEMARAVFRRYPTADVVIMAAADEVEAVLGAREPDALDDPREALKPTGGRDELNLAERTVLVTLETVDDGFSALGEAEAG